jgi:hypothetical protein
MYELSWALRMKPDWQRKAKDLGIRRKWLAEAMEEEFDSYKPDKLSRKMVSRGHREQRNLIQHRLTTCWTNSTGTLKLRITRRQLRLDLIRDT